GTGGIHSLVSFFPGLEPLDSPFVLLLYHQSGCFLPFRLVRRRCILSLLRSGPTASTVPRSDNRSYVRLSATAANDVAASMGPRSDNRGYVSPDDEKGSGGAMLQWVRGPITAVMQMRAPIMTFEKPASMGPRSDETNHRVVRVKTL